MSLYISNAFSLNMLNFDNNRLTPIISEVTIDKAKSLALTGQSVVGHENTAKVFSSVLGVDIAFNRTNLKLDNGDMLLVGQYSGPRLDEGTTELPENATIKWILMLF